MAVLGKNIVFSLAGFTLKNSLLHLQPLGSFILLEKSFKIYYTHTYFSQWILAELLGYLNRNCRLPVFAALRGQKRWVGKDCVSACISPKLKFKLLATSTLFGSLCVTGPQWKILKRQAETMK